MLRKWYYPSWCGDYRLEARMRDTNGGYRDPGAEEVPEVCVLTVTDPTPAEIEELALFLEKAKWQGWASKLAGLRETGTSQLEIKAPLWEAAHVLLGLDEKPREGLLTTVVSENGEVRAFDTSQGKMLTRAEVVEGARAVTTRRPTLCCPSCAPGAEMRASRVLRAFCTPAQWQTWVERGYLICVGNLSGDAYRVAHRHSPLGIKQGKCAWDLTYSHVMHAHYAFLPPPEEVLALKLTLEHREHWIRNGSGCCYDLGSNYINPFMSSDDQSGDGIDDARFTRSLGVIFREMAQGAKVLLKEAFDDDRS